MDAEFVRQWLTGLGRYFRITLLPFTEEVLDTFNGSLIRQGIRKEDTLLISDQVGLLRCAQELGVAVLACEPSDASGNVIERDSASYKGFRIIVQSVWETDREFLIRCFQREHNLPWTILETRRVVVREETENDLDRIYPMYEQEHIIRFLEPPFADREKEMEYMRQYRKYIYEYYEYGLWHVIDKETGLSVGRAGLNPKTYEDNVDGVELGYMIVAPFLRQGYCMEVCEAIITYAKNRLNLSQIFCLIRPENTVSIHIAEKLGFTYEKTVTDNRRQMMRFVMRLARYE